jgi:FG-GAP-like repeat
MRPRRSSYAGLLALLTALGLVAFAVTPAFGSVSAVCGHGSCTQSLFDYSGDVKVPGQAFSSAAGDFNRDGIPDLAVANDTSSIYVFLGQGGTSFGSPTAYPDGLAGRAVASGYFNDDSKLDLAIADRVNNKIQILFGDGSGGFGSPTGYSVGNFPVAISVGDFNNDQHPDLAVVNQSDSNLSILLNDGSGGFSPGQTLDTGINRGPVSIGDFNGDGNLDILSGTLFLGNGHGGFTHTSTLTGLGNVPGLAGDFNGDGHLDVAYPYGGAQGQYDYAYLGYQHGGGSGGFGPLHQDFASPGFPTTGAVGDFNLDHSADAIVAIDDTVDEIGGTTIALGGGRFGFDVPGATAGLYSGVQHAPSVTVAQLNDDREPDFIVTGDSPYVTVAFNAGPHKPAVGGTAPASPANNTTPLVQGAAEPGTRVSLYDNASCSGAAIASGLAARFYSPGLRVTVPPNKTTAFNATTRYSDGRTSECSRDPVAYQEDSVAPAPFSLVSPSDGAKVGPQPTLLWQHTRDGGSGMDHFTLRMDGSAMRRLTPGVNYYQPPSRLGRGEHTWSVWAVDKAGNVRKSGGRSFRVR